MIITSQSRHFQLYIISFYSCCSLIYSFLFLSTIITLIVNLIIPSSVTSKLTFCLSVSSTISKLFLSWSYCCIIYFVYFTLAYIFLSLTMTYTFYQLLQSVYTLLCTFLDCLISVFLYSNPKLCLLYSN